MGVSNLHFIGYLCLLLLSLASAQNFESAISNEISDDLVENPTQQPPVVLPAEVSPAVVTPEQAPPVDATVPVSYNGITENVLSNDANGTTYSEGNQSAAGSSSTPEIVANPSTLSTPAVSTGLTFANAQPPVNPSAAQPPYYGGAYRPPVPTPSAHTPPRHALNVPRPRKPINGSHGQPFVKQGKCSCFGETTTIVRYYKSFESQLDLSESGLLNCENLLDATVHCENICKTKALTMFNSDMDLRQPFILQPDKRIGQVLCSQLGSVLVPSYLRIRSHTLCYGQRWSVTRDTGLRSKARFMCVLGRFQTVL